MKKFLLPLLLCLSATSFAQQGKNNQFKSFYELSKSKGIPGKIDLQFPLSANNKNRIEFEDGQAKVIQLPLDNMPCLVPDIKGFNMPVAAYVPGTSMPVLRTMPAR